MPYTTRGRKLRDQAASWKPNPAALEPEEEHGEAFGPEQLVVPNRRKAKRKPSRKLSQLKPKAGRVAKAAESTRSHRTQNNDNTTKTTSQTGPPNKNNSRSTPYSSSFLEIDRILMEPTAEAQEIVRLLMLRIYSSRADKIAENWSADKRRVYGIVAPWLNGIQTPRHVGAPSQVTQLPPVTEFLQATPPPLSVRS